MRPYLLAASTALLLALVGCASSGGLHPEGQLTEPSSLHGEKALADIKVSPAAWPVTDWWTSLGDDQLSALINEGLKGNPDLATADARARQAAAQAGAADAARAPTVNAGASVAGARLPSNLIPAPIGGKFTWTPYGYASFNWDLDLWGGKRASWEAALGKARAAEVDAKAARILVSTNIARAYVQLGYAFAQQDVAKAELDRSTQSRKLTGQRVAAGVDSQLQLKQDDGLVASAQQQVAVADHAVETARTQLAMLLGQGPDRGLSIERPHPLNALAIEAPDNLPADLVGRRADLIAARWRVEAASHGITAAKAEFMPNVTLGAMAGLASGGAKNLFSAQSLFYEVAPAISLPIFDGGRRRANLADVDAEYDIAVAQYNKVLVEAFNGIADDLTGLGSLDTQIAAEERAMDAASQAYDLAQQRYKAGVGSYLEALTVRQQLLVAQQRMAALVAQRVDLSVQLIQALGGGFNVAPTDMPNHVQS
ncbi:efflux transporter outer membrane subunit [Pinirhizobacter soli]|uniref:efflux transporter outer membrane subunit n=1 Tax=Pinirhizobacter soli TaxID=2786953 RepID=UPI00202A53CE|nr:efflux transporter outer membrane subunit [Pinirhizobacter soli]